MTKDDLLTLDKAARQRILSDTDHNFFVEASAGSGKTTLLVGRMVAMVESGIDVRKICAITFTKAAAREFYSRFQAALAEHSSNPAVDPHKRELCAEALRNIDLCFMNTIDAFCHLILSEHPKEAGIPSDAAVLDKVAMANAYLREYLRVQDGAYDNILKQKFTAFQGCSQNPKRLFLESIADFMSGRAAQLMVAPPVDPDTEPGFHKEMTLVLSTLRGILNNRPSLHTGNKTVLDKFDELQEKQALLHGRWQDNLAELIPLLKTANGLRLAVKPSSIGLRDDLFEVHMTRSTIGWYELKLSDNSLVFRLLQEYQFSVAVDFLSAFAKAVAPTLRKEGNLSFFDYQLYLRDMLRDDAATGGKLIRHIYQRHSYFLIDEFQDTNPLQAEIFFYLTAQTPQSDWTRCVPHGGSLFIVGDPKQSIYRFQGADVASFLRVKKLFVPPVGEVAILYCNFRSTDTLKTWFNNTFTALLPVETAEQSKYPLIPITGSTERGVFSGVYRYTSDAAIDSENVADMIETIVGNPAYLIRDKSGAPLRQISYRDIMVITRTKTHLQDCMTTLLQRHIPVMVEGTTVFSQCPALAALCSVLAALASPHDAMSVYGALHSHAFSLADNAIQAWVSSGNRLSIKESTGTDPVSAAVNMLWDLRADEGQMPPSALCGKVLNALFLLQKAGTENLEYLHFALQLLRQAENAGDVISLTDAVAFLQMHLNEEAGTERSLSLRPAANRVHIANLHKVKGLEAPVVILAYPSKKARGVSSRTERDASGTKRWVFSLGNGRAAEMSSAANPAKKAAEEESLAFEENRLLYVAATRAKNVLLIADSFSRSGARSNSNPWGPFLSDTLEEFRAAPVLTAPPIPAEPVTQETIWGGRTAENATYTICRPSQITVQSKLSSLDDYEDRPEESLRDDMKKRHAALLGTMTHALMEILVSSRDQCSTTDVVEDILSQYTIPAEDMDNLRKKLLSVANTMHNSGYPQANGSEANLLSVLLHADEVLCEVPFSFRETGADGAENIWHGIMDVVYREGDVWHIVDYKTNADGSDLDTYYAGQLAAYRQAFRELTGSEADARTYHIEV